MSTTVLVVDDEPIVREVVVSYLEREGYRTLEAGDGDTAPSLGKAERLTFDVLDIDASAREVTKDGDSLRLTAKEFDLLWFMANHPRQVFSRDQLMDRVWGYEAALDTGTVTVHIRRLREKIEDDPSHPRFLQTIWGVGYRFPP